MDLLFLYETFVFIVFFLLASLFAITQIVSVYRFLKEIILEKLEERKESK
jgi:predicted membrane protein